MFNPMDGRRHELARPEPPVLVGEADTRGNPAFRLHVMRSLRMHPVLAGSVAAVVFVLLVAYALGRKPVYTAESLIYVEPLEVRVLTDGSSSGYDPSRYDSYLQQQVQTVERADTLEAAVAKIPAGVWGPAGENVTSAARRLLGSLKVDRVLNSYELGIDVTAPSPAAAAAAANAVAAAYLEQGRKDEHARADQRLQLLTEEQQRITDDMTQDKAEQVTLGRTLGVANPNGASGNPYDLQSEGLRSQLAAAREAHDAVAAQLASVAGLNGKGLETAANELILTDAGLVSIRQTLSQRRAVLSDQMAGLTPANPVYKQDQEEIAGIDRAMERATDEARQRAERQLQDKLRLDLGRTADVEGRLNAQLAQQTAKATGAGPKLQRASELETDLQRLSTRYAAVDDAIRGLQLETGGPGQAHLAMAARVPDSAQPSRSKLILLLALPLALFCGVAAAVIARKRDPRLYLAGDMQEVLGFPPMCVLPNASEVSAEAFDEFVLRLAGGLEGAYRHGGARSFVFTPVSVDGRAVALLPQLCTKLRQIGFRAVCVGAAELMPSAVRKMESGSVEIGPVRAREGVAATKLERLLEEYDLVLVVAPPLLGSAITEYTVRCADATILLVESARTNRAELRRAAMLLERLNPQGIGAVLEDMPLRYADPVFRAAVRAADSWPIVQVKRAPEKTHAASAPKHKPAAPEIRLPVASVAPLRTHEEPIPEDIAEPVAVPEPPFVEQADVRSEVRVPAELVEREELYGAPRAAAPEAEPVVAAPLGTVAVPSMTSVAEEEPVAIPIEFKPLSFHDASEPPQRSEIKYFVEKPLPGMSPMQSIEVAPEISGAEVIRLTDPESGAHKRRGWAEWQQTDTPSNQVDEVYAIDEAPGEFASEREATHVAERAAIRRAEPEAFDWVTGASEEAYTHEEQSVRAVSAEISSPRAPERLEGNELSESPADAEAVVPVDLVAEEKRPVSWFQRVFGMGDERAVRVTPETIDSPSSESEVAASVAAPASLGSLTDSVAPEVGDAAFQHREIAIEVLASGEEIQHSEPSLGETGDITAAEMVRSEPPVAYEDALWVRASRKPESGGRPRVHFFLDTQQAFAVEVPSVISSAAAAEAETAPEADAQEEISEAPAEDFREAEIIAEPEVSEVVLPEEISEEHELAVGQDALVVTSPTPQHSMTEPAHVWEVAPQHAIEIAVPAEELPVLRELAAVAPEPDAPEPEWMAPVTPVLEAPGEPHAPIAADERKPERRLVTLQRPRGQASITGGPAPSLVASPPEARPQEDVAKPAERRARDESQEKATANPTVPPAAPIASGTLSTPSGLRAVERSGVQRAGLARAMRHAGIEDGPPARASGGLTAMRTGPGLRKAVVRQEAVLRAHVQPAEPARGPEGISRRWGMLSRFERIGPASDTGDRKEQDPADAVPKNGTDSPNRI